jgi:hypothetical protein
MKLSRPNCPFRPPSNSGRFPARGAQHQPLRNGSLVQARQEPPFGDFLLDLSPIKTSKLSLQLRLQDALGFETRSAIEQIELTWLDPKAMNPKP